VTESSKGIIFQVNNEEYSIPIDYVTSIEKLEDITPIPHLPAYVKGIVAVRGDLIPVIDLEQVFYQRQVEVTESTRILIIKTDELSVGILVGEAKEIIDFPAETIKQVGLIAFSKTSYFYGVANLNSRLVIMMDPFVLVKSLDGIKEIVEYMENYNH
jgi:purine-binding chemotaxis protein CheW